MSLGLSNAGHKAVASFDNWGPAVETLKKNFSHASERLDLSDEQNWNRVFEAEAELIAGGPPCQDFSIAGNRNTSGARANLTLTFAQIVTRARTKFFIMENVYSIEGTAVLEEARTLFSESGYHLTSAVLDASFLGVPQARRRYFLVGSIEPIRVELLDYYNNSKSLERCTAWQHFGSALGTDFYYAHPRSYKRRAIFSVHEPSATIRGVNRPMPLTYEFHPADKSRDRELIRPLTSRERASLQTFPEDFEFIGTASQREQLIGNAVPVRLAKFLGDFINLLEAQFQK